MIHESDWLRRKRWLDPSRCECGSRRSVIWTAWHDRDGYGEQWGMLCLTCKLNHFQADDSNHAVIVYDARETALRTAGSREVPEVHVWMRPGCVVAADRLSVVLKSFANLERARAAATRIRPGEWAVEIRDGEPWAPWDPTSGVYKRGPDLPLRKTRLRKARRERSCRSCKATLGEGSTVWVPTGRPRLHGDGGGPVTTKDGQLMATWDRRAMTTIKICAACVSGARVADTEEAGEMVRHLRVMAGGAAE